MLLEIAAYVVAYLGCAIPAIRYADKWGDKFL